MFAQLIQTLRGWLGIVPRDQAANERGIRLHQAGDHRAAIRAFNEALSYRPETAAYYANRGTARYGAGDRATPPTAGSARKPFAG